MNRLTRLSEDLQRKKMIEEEIYVNRAPNKWKKAFNSLFLKKRWEWHPLNPYYKTKALFEAMRARVFVQLLDALCTYMGQAVRLGFVFEKPKAARRKLKVVYDKFMNVGMFEIAFVQLAEQRLFGLDWRKPERTIRVSEVAIQQLNMQSSPLRMIMTTNEKAALRIRQSKILPPLLNSKLSNPHTCWSCFQTFAGPIRLQVCGGCKVARYCGAECQKTDWKKEHKRECQCMVIPKDLRRRIKRNTGPEKETYLDALVRLWNGMVSI